MRLALSTSGCRPSGPPEQGAGSEEQKARDDVCDARDDIQTNVAELEHLTLGTAPVDRVKSHLNATRDDLRKISDAEDQLNDTQKQRVQKANETFKSQLKTLTEDLGRSVSLEDPAQQLESDLAELATVYRQSFAPIDFGDESDRG